MIAFDTSVLVAGFSSWHEHHESAVASLDAAAEPVLIAHCALETVSTLTRMPEPLRVAADDVVLYLRSWFGSELIALDALASSTLMDELVGRRIDGGAVYDGLVAATARAHGATLTSADRRARETYSALDVSVVWLAGIA
ncbi:MAG: PIN domain-containing protein [Thermoleophilaceae bacterium]|nr:PIN domain-containing protein [Thermoleophilaceae bacterium]